MDTQVLKSKFKESFFIGGISFAAPFLGAMFYAYHVLGWSWPASKIAGIALSTTSLAVVYAVLVETGLTMGTISSVFGLTGGFVNQIQFSVLVAAVVLSAIIPTFIAQKWFEPAYQLPENNEDFGS